MTAAEVAVRAIVLFTEFRDLFRPAT